MAEEREAERVGQFASNDDDTPVESYKSEKSIPRSPAPEEDNTTTTTTTASHGSIRRVSEDSIGHALENIASGGVHDIAQIATATSVGSAGARPAEFEVEFEAGENPREWPLWYRIWVLFIISFSAWSVVLYSTTYTSSIPGMMDTFHVTDETVATLGVTTYLIGVGLGGLFWAPISELYGRKPVYIVTLFMFTLLILPTCLATSLTEVIVVRFFGALFGSAMVVNSAATVVDVSTEENRALVFSLWALAPLNGPVTGPVIGGFVFEYLGWRWDNWLVLILSGASTFAVMTTKETYGPNILQAKAARLRKETGDERWWTRYEVNLPLRQLIRNNLVRPFVLFFSEPILWFFNLWISIVYGILYLCFVAYPIVFTDHRGWGPGLTGLSFIGIGIGTTIGILAEPLWRRIINHHPVDPVTGRRPPEAIGRVLVIGSLLTPIGQLVFAWTSLPTSIHWAVPIAFGIPFGLGNSFSFIYGTAYISSAYTIYAASALAGNALMRSLLGGLLPLAGPALFSTLTPRWAGTFLGLLEVILIPIPFAFWRYGARIRARSPTIRALREDQEKQDQEAARRIRRMERQKQKDAAADDGGDFPVDEET
ncbi:major facilitator superfamily domain-containing protein, partial [Xylaria sp. CBS 124048]